MNTQYTPMNVSQKCHLPRVLVHLGRTFIGVYCVFMPMHYLGLAGNVRRYSAFTDEYLQPLIPLHRFITIAALFTGAVQLIFLFNLIRSRLRGPIAPAKPVGSHHARVVYVFAAAHDNFGGHPPVVTTAPTNSAARARGTT